MPKPVTPVGHAGAPGLHGVRAIASPSRYAGATRLFAVLVLAAVVRLVAFALFDGHVPGGDPANFLRLASLVASGEPLALIDRWYGHFQALYPPLYPLLLGIIGAAAGVNLVTVLAFNFALDLGAAAAIRKLWGNLPAAIFLLWPTIVVSAPVAQKESLLIFLSAWLFVVFVNAYRSRSLNAPAFGLLSGLLALAQPALLPLPIFLGMLLWGRIPIFRQGLVTALVTIAVIAPWSIRNWLLLEHFVPLTTGPGLALHVAAFGHGKLPDAILSLPELQRVEYLWQRGAEWIASNPFEYVHQALWNGTVSLFGESVSIGRLTPLLLPLMLFEGLHLVLLGLATMGWRSADPSTRRIVFAVGLTIITAIWLEFGERHRYFAFPVLFALLGQQAANAANKRPLISRRSDSSGAA